MRFISRFLRAVFTALGFAVACGAAFSQTGDCIVTLQGKTVCPPAKTVCLMERSGATIKCSPRDGGIVADRYGAAMCGVGRCILDFHGEPVCSKEAGGAAAIDMSSVAVCSGGCEKAQAGRCSTLKP
jgi:uncharacterized membrane protein